MLFLQSFNNSLGIQRVSNQLLFDGFGFRRVLSSSRGLCVRGFGKTRRVLKPQCRLRLFDYLLIFTET